MQNFSPPSGFFTSNTGLAKGLALGLIHPASSNSWTYLWINSCYAGACRYGLLATGLAPGTNLIWCSSPRPRNGGRVFGSSAGHTSLCFVKMVARLSRTAPSLIGSKCLAAPSGRPVPSYFTCSTYSQGDPIRSTRLTISFTALTADADRGVEHTRFPQQWGAAATRCYTSSHNC